MASANKLRPWRRWQEVAEEAQQYRDDSVAQAYPELREIPSSLPKNVMQLPDQVLELKDLEITEALPEEILTRLSTGELTATHVTVAFLHRASLAQKLVCSLHVEHL